jgi:hypothetical protein
MVSTERVAAEESSRALDGLVAERTLDSLRERIRIGHLEPRK